MFFFKIGGYRRGERVDMFHAFGAHGVPLVGDDEPGSLAPRHEELHTSLDVFVVETFMGDIEEVIALGLVEVEPHIDLVVVCLVGLCRLQCGLAVSVQ